VHKTVVGSRLRRANDQEDILAQRALVLSQEVSELSAANIENLITELTSLMTSQKAARQAYSMVSQSSLFDFVK
jgi:flagellar hook-associated protein 3 FlgL